MNARHGPRFDVSEQGDDKFLRWKDWRRRRKAVWDEPLRSWNLQRAKDLCRWDPAPIESEGDFHIR